MPDPVGLDQMRISVANLFRIHPPFQLEMTDQSAAVLEEAFGGKRQGIIRNTGDNVREFLTPGIDPVLDTNAAN